MDLRKLGVLSTLVSTKGTKDLSDTRNTEGTVGPDSPAYYLDNNPVQINRTIDFSSYKLNKNEIKKVKNIVGEIATDIDEISILSKDTLAEMAESGIVELVDFTLDDIKAELKDISKVNKLTRIRKEVIEKAIKLGVKFFEIESKRIEARFNKNSCPMFVFENPSNNIGIINKKDGSDLFFLDGFCEVTKEGPIKNKYVNELIIEKFIEFKLTKVTKMDGLYGDIEIKKASLKSIFNMLVYKTQYGSAEMKNTYVSMIGGRGRESWNLRADVIKLVDGNICWLLETDFEEIGTVEEAVDFIKKNPCVVLSSMAQGERFKIMADENSAKKEDLRFIEAKYNIDTSILPSMKVDKAKIKKNMVFLTLANRFDINLYGNAIWEENYAGKVYACQPDGKPVRVKYIAQKNENEYKIVGTDGNVIKNWVICPLHENSNETYEFEEKNNIAQLVNMGYTPESCKVTYTTPLGVDVEIETVVFKDIPLYVDYLVSSDYNTGRNFELKPYSTMLSALLCMVEEIKPGNAKKLIAAIGDILDIQKAAKIMNIGRLEVTKVKLAKHSIKK